MMVKTKLSLEELKKEVRKDFKKDDTLTGFEIKKAIENIFKRLGNLEK